MRSCGGILAALVAQIPLPKALVAQDCLYRHPRSTGLPLKALSEAGKDSLESLRDTREAGKDQSDSLQGTREVGTEAPGRQERINGTACEAPGRQARTI